MHPIKVVIQFPPNELLNIIVNFDSLKGGCPYWGLFGFVNASTTFCKVYNDLLIKIDSFKFIPVVPDFVILSLPAKSTKLNLENKK